MSKNRWAKRKGTQAERELIDFFWEKEGWCAHRIAGSGSSKYPSPDLIVGNNLRKLALEVKTTFEKKKYFTGEEIYALKEFSNIFGAEAWIAIKILNKDWYFVNLEDLNQSGKSFNICLDDLKNKGLLFEELIK